MWTLSIVGPMIVNSISVSNLTQSFRKFFKTKDLWQGNRIIYANFLRVPFANCARDDSVQTVLTSYDPILLYCLCFVIVTSGRYRSGVGVGDFHVSRGRYRSPDGFKIKNKNST